MEKKIFKITLSVVLVVVTIIGIGVAGILQSTQKIETTGQIEIPPPPVIIPPTPSPPPPEPVIKVEAYVDENCTIKIDKIDWKVIHPGGSATSKIYVLNKGDVGLDLSYSIENYDPTNLNEYITVSWDYDGKRLEPSKIPIVINIKLTVSSDCPEIDVFNFDFIILGS